MIITHYKYSLYFTTSFSLFQLFDRLRKEQPNVLNKVIPIYGDITLEELGISESDQVKYIFAVSSITQLMIVCIAISATSLQTCFDSLSLCCHS